MTPRTRISTFAFALLLCTGTASADTFPPHPLERVAPGEDRLHAELIDAFRKSMEISRHKGRLLRGGESKTHGCIRGTLEVLAERPERAQHGLFARQGRYPLWARFSNTAPSVRSDALPDARAIALKILGVEGRKLLASDRSKSHDFLLRNARGLFVRDAKEFLAMMRASLRRIDEAKYLVTNPMVGARIAKASLKGRLLKDPLQG